MQLFHYFSEDQIKNTFGLHLFPGFNRLSVTKQSQIWLTPIRFFRSASEHSAVIIQSFRRFRSNVVHHTFQMRGVVYVDHYFK